jgi:hypothetical protein
MAIKDKATARDTARVEQAAERLADAMRAGALARRRAGPYSGALARPIDLKQCDVAAIPNQLAAAFQAVAHVRAARVPLLFEWHGIEPGDWQGLALALARAHVPGFQESAPAWAKPRRGRPRKVRNALFEAMRTPRQSGRPARWTPDLLHELLATADRWRETERKAGRRASDRAFVEWLCGQHAKNTGERPRVVISRESGALRNALSRARRAVSKS